MTVAFASYYIDEHLLFRFDDDCHHRSYCVPRQLILPGQVANARDGKISSVDSRYVDKMLLK